MQSITFNPATDINFNIALIIKSEPPINISELVKTVTLPAINMNYYSTGYQNNRGNFSADTFSFGEVDIEFLVDEHFSSYTLLLNWANSIKNSSNNIPYAELTVQFLDSYQTPQSEITFKNLVPANIGNITLQTGVTTNELILPVSFAVNGISYQSKYDNLFVTK